MEITQSRYSESVPQEDGRWWVKEVHIDSDGNTHEYEWLSDGSLNAQMVMEERAAHIAAVLTARENARAVAAGTKVALTRFEFLSRFTPEERVAIRTEAKINPLVEDFLELMNATATVFPSLARPGLLYMVYQGLLTEERATTIGAE